MKVLLLLLLIHFAIAAEWHCGSGRVSTAIAWTLSLPAMDREHINNCCKAHDDQYDRIFNGTSLLTTSESDLLFSNCLQSSSYRLVPLYNAATKLESGTTLVKQFEEFLYNYKSNPLDATKNNSTCMNTYTVIPSQKRGRFEMFQTRVNFNYAKCAEDFSSTLAHLFLLPLRIAVSGLDQIARFLLI
ncbi:unnamed protein product [Caenorhabditis nigoni]